MGAVSACGSKKRRDGGSEPDAKAGSEYAYVGEGRGKYVEVQQLVYVGEGNGSISLEDEKGGKEGSASAADHQRVCIMAAIVLLLGAGGVCLVISLLHGPKAPVETPQTASKVAVSTADSSLSTGARPAALRPASVDCKGLDQASWPVRQKTYCCAYEGVGCPEFDCEAGFDRWEREWSDGKQDWCCRHKSRACAATTTAAAAGAANAAAAAAAQELATKQAVLKADEMLAVRKAQGAAAGSGAALRVGRVGIGGAATPAAHSGGLPA